MSARSTRPTKRKNTSSKAPVIDPTIPTATGATNSTETFTEVIDSMKQIANSMSQAVAQLVQITQGVTTAQTAAQVTGQMTGQRADRTDTSANATKQDVGSDELKDLVGGLASVRSLDGIQLADEREFKALLRTINAGIVQNGANVAHLIMCKTTENTLGVNVTDLTEAAAVKALTAKGYSVTK